MRPGDLLITRVVHLGGRHDGQYSREGKIKMRAPKRKLIIQGQALGGPFRGVQVVTDGPESNVVENDLFDATNNG